MRILLITLSSTFAGLLALSACSDDTSGGSADAAIEETGADSAKKDAKSDTGITTDASSCKLVRPYSSKDVDCNECAEAKCCAVVNACFDEKDCDDGYVNCLIGCALEKKDAGPDGGDPLKACKDECAIDYPKGKPLYDAFSSCVDGACAVPCK